MLIVIPITIVVLLWMTYDRLPIVDGESALYIDSSYIDDIYSSMEKSGYHLYPFDRFLMRFVQLPDRGWYKVADDNRSRYSFFANLYKKRDKTIDIVVFAGDTNEEMCQRLSKDMKLSKAKLKEYYSEFTRFKEGNILAGRYTLSRSADEKVAIRYLLYKSYQELDFFAKEKFGMDFPVKDLRDSIIVASIIQKESNDIDEMSYISSVISNRLKKNMRLQMDGTLNYGKYSRTIVTSDRIKNDTSRYNTYKYKGLPPAPLSIVSMDALEAATFPRQSDYLFFMLNEKGKHDFATTYKEHLQNVKAFKRYCRAKKEKIEKEKIEKEKIAKEKIAKEKASKEKVKKEKVKKDKTKKDKTKKEKIAKKKIAKDKSKKEKVTKKKIAKDKSKKEKIKKSKNTIQFAGERPKELKKIRNYSDNNSTKKSNKKLKIIIRDSNRSSR